MKNNPAHYDVGSILLHWAVALLILLVGLSSFFLNAGSEGFSTIITAFHNAAGAMAMALVIVWFGWRAMHAELPEFEGIGTAERRLMVLINGAINVLLILVPVTGMFLLFALERSLDLGLIEFSYVFSMSQNNLQLLSLAHNVLGKLLLVLALLHSAQAHWHHFGRRDEFVRRLLP